MTKKKKKAAPRPSSIPRNLICLGQPVATLRLVSNGPLENGRAWVATETLYSSDLVPGTSALISLGPQTPLLPDPKKPLSTFAPVTLGDEQFSTYPPENLYSRWAVSDREEVEEMGRYCVGCEVWPNATLRKGEIQLSSSLTAQLGAVDIGSVIYLHSLERRPPACVKLHLGFLLCVSVVGGEERRKWLEEMLEKKGNAQMHILNTLMKHQLHGRLLLKHNLVPVSLLGCTLVMQVLQLQTSEADEEMAIVDGDITIISLKLESAVLDTEDVEESDFLKRVTESAGDDLKGSQKEAAVSGALQAARSGISSLEREDLDRIVLPDALLQSLHSLVNLPLTRASLFTSMGLTPPRGVILHGPPGSGKTLIASWAARMSNAHLFVINGPSLVSEFYGGSESGLKGIFRAAQAVSPSLVFFDEVDAILPSRGNRSRSLTDSGTQDSRIRQVTTLLAEFDALQGSPVVVLAATNRLEAIDGALRRPGRFDREIEMTVPTPTLRLSIFNSHLRHVPHTLSSRDISDLASDTHGFLPADISYLCREASLCALRRYLTLKGPLNVEKSDFEKAESLICPSGLRELQVEIPRVTWDDIGGLEDVKQRLRESVEWPLRHASSLGRMGTPSPKGVLLFGPPGCSKTLLAKAIATETGMNFISVAGSEMVSMFVGESEKAVARLFTRARQVAPCIVFMDEVDGLMSHRDSSGDDGTSQGQRIMSQLLAEMDGIRDRGHVVVIGATNKPQLIDPAMLRPGRFDRLILVPPPDVQARKAIFEIQLRAMSVGLDVDCEELAKKSEGYTGADIASVCREAGIRALEENMDAVEIKMTHFLAALADSVPSIGQNDQSEIKIYESFRRGS